MLMIDEQISIFNVTDQDEPVSMDSCVFFDIETTGFSASREQVYLIGCIHWQDSKPHLMQWFAQSPEDEPLILQQFFEYIHRFHTIIHFNGDGFDIPFLKKRCGIHGLTCHFRDMHSLDIYKSIAPYKHILKLANPKQKTVEQFLGLYREDTFSGGDLISVYKDYVQSPSDQLLHLLLLHNAEDLTGMLQCYRMLAYPSLFQGNIYDTTCYLHNYEDADGNEKEEIIFTSTCNKAIPKEFSYKNDSLYITGKDSTIKLAVPVRTGELKYFFPNYKDYYYLPMEDMAVHKSVATYVDKAYRKQATAATCYIKKSGRYLPQTEEVMTPCFKDQYKDAHSYLEVTDGFLANPQQMTDYVKHLLKNM